MKESVIYQEILREGEIKGEMRGKIEGKLEAKLEVAQNLLRNQMTIEQVVMFTGLPQDSVEELAQNLTNET
jgi:predicted transposase/invertase (TIGR01784 family)